MAYQDTPHASKRNAFCWNTWEPRINWRSAAQQAQGAKQSERIDAKRSTGVDMLHIPGMGSATRHNPMEVMRFALATASRRRA
jgi:hypothetical protein